MAVDRRGRGLPARLRTAQDRPAGPAGLHPQARRGRARTGRRGPPARRHRRCPGRPGLRPVPRPGRRGGQARGSRHRVCQHPATDGARPAPDPPHPTPEKAIDWASSPASGPSGDRAARCRRPMAGCSGCARVRWRTSAGPNDRNCLRSCPPSRPPMRWRRCSAWSSSSCCASPTPATPRGCLARWNPRGRRRPAGARVPGAAELLDAMADEASDRGRPAARR